MPELLHRWKDPHRKLSIGLLLTNLSILAVPLLAIIIIYITAYNSLLQYQKEKNLKMLTYMADSLEQQLTEIRNVERYIVNDEDLVALLRYDGVSRPEAGLFDMYQLVRGLPDYKLTNTIIQDIYILFNDQNYMIKYPTLVPGTEISWQSVTSLRNYTFEEILDHFSSVYMHGKLETIEKRDDYNYEIAIVQSFPYLSMDAVYGSVVIQLSHEQIREQFASILMGTKGMGILYDENGNIIKCISEPDCLIEPDSLDFHPDLYKNFETIKLGAKSYLMCNIRGNSGFTYATLIPKSEISAQIGFIKYIMILLCVLSIAIGLSVCLYYAKKRREVLKHYLECGTMLAPDSAELNVSLQKNYSFWSGFRFFLDSVSNLHTTVMMQGNLLKTTVLRKLLYAEYQNEEELVSDMKSASLDLSSPKYCVMSIDFSRNMPEIGKRDNGDFRLVKKLMLEQEITIPHYYFEIDYAAAALILLCPEDLEKESLLRQIDSLYSYAAQQKSIQLFVGLSDFCTEILQISEMYEQASAICTYEKYYNIRMAISNEDLPPKEEIFFFPMELELRFIKAFRSSGEKELSDVLEEIKDENFVNRTLSPSMIKHLTEALRAAVIRTLKDLINTPPCSIPISSDLLRMLRIWTNCSG